MFDIVREETLLEKSLKRGSGFEGGTVRIMAAAMTMDKARFTDYLRKEFGIGGCSIEGGFFDHNNAGCEIRLWKQEHVDKYKWSVIADTYLGMIAVGSFPDEKTTEKLDAIRSEFGSIPEPIPRFQYPYNHVNPRWVEQQKKQYEQEDDE